jgi:hypothetical protein
MDMQRPPLRIEKFLTVAWYEFFFFFGIAPPHLPTLCIRHTNSLTYLHVDHGARYFEATSQS